MEGQGNTPHPKEHPMTTIKRLLRRLDGYTLEAFNAPATRRPHPGPALGPLRNLCGAWRRWA